MLRIQSTVMLAVLLTASLVFAYSQVTSPNPAYAIESGPNSEVTLREQERQRALAQHYSHPTAESLRPGGSKWERYFEYDADYYATSDFTRIYADKPLQAGEQRKPLQPLSGLIGHGRPHQKHREPIAVQAVPDAPVTFYAPDFGEFSNGSRSITIQADATGRAEVEFTYGAMASYYRVVAHSPEMQPGSWVVFEFSALSDVAWERLEAFKKGGGSHE